MEPRRFGQPSCAMIVGGMIAMVGAIISGLAGYHLVTGIALMQSTSKFSSGGEHVASRGELWFGILGGLPFLVLGLALILVTVNAAITIDERGIIATDMIRRKTFQATWPEIASFERIDSTPDSGYKLVANGKTLRIAIGMKDLIAEIRRLSPNLPKS